MGTLRRNAVHGIGLLLALGCGFHAVERPEPGRPGTNSATAGSSAGPVSSSSSGASVAGPPAPPRGITPDWQLPTASREQLSSGLAVTTVVRRQAPVASVRLVVWSGTATDDDEPGVARLTAELMAEAGAGNWTRTRLWDRLAELGTALTVRASPDAIEWSMAVTSNHVEAALDILGAVAQRPRLSIGPFSDVRARSVERARNAARHDLGWGASWVVYRELFQLPTHAHPYASFDATEAQLEKLRLADCLRFYRTHVTPKNTELLVVGDIDPEAVRQRAETAFRGWKGARPTQPRFMQPVAPLRLRVYLVDYPKSARAELRLGLLGPDVRDADLASVAVATDLLGAPAGGRLALDLVRSQSVATRAQADLSPVAHGPAPLLISASTTTEAIPTVVTAVLDHIRRLAEQEPRPTELIGATQRLATRQARRSESVEGLSALLVEYDALGWSKADVDGQRDTWRRLTAPILHAEARRYFRTDRAVIVIATDARRVERSLSRFGEVEVVAPEQGFTVRRRLAHDPSAPPRVADPG